MKTKINIICLLAALVGILNYLALLSQAQSPPPAPTSVQTNASSDPLSTPQLIEAALNRGEIDQDTANLYLAYALGNPEKLPEPYRSGVPWDGTVPLLHLHNGVRLMKNSLKQQEVIIILSGSCSSSSSSLPNIQNTTHFHVQYNTIGGGLNINNYLASLETTWTKEIDQFGWATPPVLSSNPPPGNRYHVRIDTLSTGLYGYVSLAGTHAGFAGDNPNTVWNEGDAYASCMVLNRDYTGFPDSPQKALDATTAHEFNHSIQYGLGAITGANAPDLSFIEGGATWMEDEVFDTANDNYNYLWPKFNVCMGEYVPSPNFPYPYWITFRGLTERYGTGTAGAGEQVMQDFWELTSQSSSSNLLAVLNTALVNKGTTLANAYHAYAVAVKFNKPCGGGYIYPYCFEEGSNYVAAAGSTPVNGNISSVGSSFNGTIADNYALQWVSLPTSASPYTVTLQNTSGGGQLRASVVCDTGATLNVNALPTVASTGNSTSLANFNPAGCSNVVAVVTNQAQTANNPSSCSARTYTLSTAVGTSTCSPDIYEPDGNYTLAKLIQPQAHTFDILGDEDWGKFTMTAGRVYTITTSNLGASNDTYMYLYDINGTTILAQDDDGGPGLGSQIVQTAPSSGTYYVRVRHFSNSGGCTGYNYDLAVTEGTGLVEPIPLAAVPLSQTQIHLSWPDLNTGESGYKIERSPNAPVSWTQVATVGANITTYTDTGLTPGTTYFYQVRAYNAAGNSAPSNQASATTLPGGGNSITRTLYLPIVVKACVPSPPGESNNIADALTICSRQTVSGQVNDSDWDDVYKIWVVANQTLTISMNGVGVGGPGDADLYLYPPDTTDVNTDPAVDFSDNIGNSEFIQGTALVGGFWYIDVFDCCEDNGGTNYNVTVTLSGPNSAQIKTFNLPEVERVREHNRQKLPK